MVFRTFFPCAYQAVFGIAFALGMVLGALSGATVASADVKLDARLGQDVLVTGKTQRAYVRVSLEGISIKSLHRRTPVNIALVLDRSGSMKGKKLNQAKEAAIMALNRLNRDDVASIVAYDDIVRTLVPATLLSDRDVAQARIANIEAGGRTALYAGVERGLHEVDKFLAPNRVNRVILLSDGLANIGPSTPAELGRLGRKAAGAGVSITTIGLGLGYNEDLMARLAGASDGNHTFVEYAEDLVGVFDKEFGDVLSVVAQDITITIECGTGFRPIRILGRDAKIAGQTVEMRLNQVYGAQNKYALLEVEVPAEMAVSGNTNIARVNIVYTSMRTGARETASGTVDARFSTSMAEVSASTDNDVMTAVTTQIATMTSEDAVNLRDNGDVKGARKLLEDNAVYLRQKAKQYNAPVLDRLGRENAASAGQLSDSDWTKSRKSLRSNQYRQKYLQSY